MADLIMFVEGIKSCINGDDIENMDDLNFLQGFAVQYEFEQILTSKTGG